MDGGAWWAAVHGVAKSRTWLSDFNFTFHFHSLEKEMATHSSVLAWRIPGTGEPGGLPSMGLHRVGHDWSNLAAAAAIWQWRITFNQMNFKKMCMCLTLICGSVQFSHSVMSNSATPWIAARQASLSITNSRSSPKPMSIKSVMPSSHLILCRPLLLLPPIPPSIRVFSSESTLRMRWPKYWSFSFSIIPSKDWFCLEWSGWISLQSKWLYPTLNTDHFPTQTFSDDSFYLNLVWIWWVKEEKARKQSSKIMTVFLLGTWHSKLKYFLSDLHYLKLYLM